LKKELVPCSRKGPLPFLRGEDFWGGGKKGETTVPLQGGGLSEGKEGGRKLAPRG